MKLSSSESEVAIRSSEAVTDDQLDDRPNVEVRGGIPIPDGEANLPLGGYIPGIRGPKDMVQFDDVVPRGSAYSDRIEQLFADVDAREAAERGEAVPAESEKSALETLSDQIGTAIARAIDRNTNEPRQEHDPAVQEKLHDLAEAQTELRQEMTDTRQELTEIRATLAEHSVATLAEHSVRADQQSQQLERQSQQFQQQVQQLQEQVQQLSTLVRLVSGLSAPPSDTSERE